MINLMLRSFDSGIIWTYEWIELFMNEKKRRFAYIEVFANSTEINEI